MEYDELELDTLGEEKTALFVIISDTDATFNFVVSIMYSQLFNLLCDKADDVYNGRLPVHVRMLLDEFANIGKIPQFEKLIATIRSREISASIILQSKSQLKAIYKDNADTIEGNCDTTLFLGGKEKTTLKELAEVLGKETIDLYNTSDTRGTSQSYGLNYQKTGKELMSQDEIAVMDGGKCIMQLRGVRPFFSDKFDITKHKRYKELSDFDPKNAFDIEDYVKHLQHRFNHMVGRYNDIYRVQMPNITHHICRHTYCSNMAKSGMSPKTLQYLMGHSDISVTMNAYTHIGFDDAEEELKRMEEFRKAQAEVEQKKEKPMSQKMFKVV